MQNLCSAEGDIYHATNNILLSIRSVEGNFSLHSSIYSVQASQVSVLEEVTKRLCTGGRRCLIAVWRNKSPTFKAMKCKKKKKVPERARTHRVCSNSSAKCRTAEAEPRRWDENVPQPAEGFGLALMFIFVAVWFSGGFAWRHGNRIYASYCPPTFSLTSVASPLLPWALRLFIPTVRSSPATAAIPSPMARLHPLYLHLISIRCCPICDSGHFVFTAKSSLGFTCCAPFPVGIPPFMSFCCLAHFWSYIIQDGARREERNRLVT